MSLRDTQRAGMPVMSSGGASSSSSHSGNQGNQTCDPVQHIWVFRLLSAGIVFARMKLLRAGHGSQRVEGPTIGSQINKQILENARFFFISAKLVHALKYPDSDEKSNKLGYKDAQGLLA